MMRTRRARVLGDVLLVGDHDSVRPVVAELVEQREHRLAC